MFAYVRCYRQHIMLVDSLPKDSAHRPFTYSELPRNLTIAETLFPQLENSLPVEASLWPSYRQVLTRLSINFLAPFSRLLLCSIPPLPLHNAPPNQFPSLF